MFLFVIGILALVASIGIIISVLKKCKNGMFPKKKKAGSAACGACLVLGIALISISCITSIPTGHTGIVTTFGRVEDYTY